MENKFLKDNAIAKWLDNRLNDDDKNKLEASGELDDLKIVLDEIDTWQVQKFDVEAGLAALKEKNKTTLTPTGPKSSTARRWLSIAASIVILISVGFFSWNYLSPKTTTIETLVAESKTIQLPCESEVNLDALSSISYNKKNWENNRTINLSGQAFFNITKGNTFKVITKNGTIDVLGTQFNVHITETKFEVYCYEGKVQVTKGSQTEILTKGQAVLTKNNELIRSNHNENAPGWKLGFSKYNHATLKTIVADLQKYYSTEIILPKKYENLQFTGKITHSDLDTALQTLFTSMEINYKLDANNKVTLE